MIGYFFICFYMFFLFTLPHFSGWRWQNGNSHNCIHRAAKLRTRHRAHLNTTTLESYKTWLLLAVACCCGLLLAAWLRICKIFKNRLEGVQKWPQNDPKMIQNDTKMTSKSGQMGSKIVPLRVWAHFWRPWRASLLFLTFFDAILGSILKVF